MTWYITISIYRFQKTVKYTAFLKHNEKQIVVISDINDNEATDRVLYMCGTIYDEGYRAFTAEEFEKFVDYATIVINRAR